MSESIKRWVPIPTGVEVDVGTYGTDELDTEEIAYLLRVGGIDARSVDQAVSSAQERAADIAHDAMDGEGWNAMTIVDALHAANLLVDDDTARLVERGRQAEEADAHVDEFLAGVTDEDRERLQADIRQQARHLALGRAVEGMRHIKSGNRDYGDGWNQCLDAIYREAGVERLEAEDVLADRRVFMATSDVWDRFAEALDRPAQDVPGLKKLMNAIYREAGDAV